MTSLLTSALACVLVSCADIQPALQSQLALAPPPPNVRLGPTLELLKLPLDGDAVVKTVADRRGNVHVLVASYALGNVTELVVSPDGTFQRNMIIPHYLRDSWLGSLFKMLGYIDAAYDSTGNLHAIVNQEHWIKHNDQWQRSDPREWRTQGIDAGCGSFIPGTPELTWLCTLNAGDVGDPSHLKILGLPVFPFIFGAWYEHDSLLFVMSETSEGKSRWVVVKRTKHSVLDTNTPSIYLAEADDEGNVHIIYDETPCHEKSCQFGIACCDQGRRYVKISAQSLKTGDAKVGDDLSSSEIKHGQKVEIVESQPFDVATVSRKMAQNGLTYIEIKDEDQYLIKVSATNPLPRRRLRPEFSAGGDYEVMKYDKFNGGHWLSPVEVGFARSNQPSYVLARTSSIVSASPDLALVVWRNDDTIVGRWVEELH